jgi:hypothetical protein
MFVICIIARPWNMSCFHQDMFHVHCIFLWDHVVYFWSDGEWASHFCRVAFVLNARFVCIPPIPRGTGCCWCWSHIFFYSFEWKLVLMSQSGHHGVGFQSWVVLTKWNDEVATRTKAWRSSQRFRSRRLGYGMIHTSLQRLHSKRK